MALLLRKLRVPWIQALPSRGSRSDNKTAMWLTGGQCIHKGYPKGTGPPHPQQGKQKSGKTLAKAHHFKFINYFQNFLLHIFRPQFTASNWKSKNVNLWERRLVCIYGYTIEIVFSAQIWSPSLPLANDTRTQTGPSASLCLNFTVPNLESSSGIHHHSMGSSVSAA